MENNLAVKCRDCGRPYGDEHGFPDLVIPSWAWAEICRRGRHSLGEVLCPSCICKRLHAAGISCEGAFTSGPIESVPRATMTALRRIEDLTERLDNAD
jgi:hypothetical protein